MLIKGDIDGVLVFNIIGWFNFINNWQDLEVDYNWLNFGDFGLDFYFNGVMVLCKLIVENFDVVCGLVWVINCVVIEIGIDLDVGVVLIIVYDNFVKVDLEWDCMIFVYECLM